MLIFPKSWRKFTGGAVAYRLFSQIYDVTAQREFQHCLFAAALDVQSAAACMRTGELLPIRPKRNLCWQIRDFTYKLLPVVNNEVLRWCSEIKDELRFYIFVVAPKHDWLLQQALRTTLGDNLPTLFTIDSFTSWRILFDSYDLQQEQESTLLELFQLYNDRIRKSRFEEQLTVRLPQKPGTKVRNLLT